MIMKTDRAIYSSSAYDATFSHPEVNKSDYPIIALSRDSRSSIAQGLAISMQGVISML